MVFRWFNILNYILPWVDLKKNLENLRDMLFSTLKSAIISKIQIISLWMVDISTDTCYSNWTCVMCSIALVHIFTTRAFLPPPHKRCIILHTKYMNAKHARLLLLLPPPSPSPPIHRHQVFNYPPCTSSAVNACTHTHTNSITRFYLPSVDLSEKICLVAEANAKQRASLRSHRLFRIQSEIAFQWD